MSQAAAHRQPVYSANRAETEAARLVNTLVISRYLDAKRAEAKQAGGITRERGLALLGSIAEDSW